MALARRIAHVYARTGPNPALIIRYLTDRLQHKARQGSLRRNYRQLIAEPPAGRLGLPALDVPGSTILPFELGRATERLRAEADAALEHRFDLLGSGPVALGPRIDWHQDFKSGYRWPMTFYQDVEIVRMSDASDPKVPWELSRGHQLLALARAAVLWRDERYATELERQLDSWLIENPVGVGINWTNAMEVAIRAVNWVWALATLEQWRPTEPGIRSRVTRSLQSHARHIALNLEGSPVLRGNHYLADMLGLLVLSSVLDRDPRRRAWERLARKAFEREISQQVLPDGVSFEASLPYHGFVLEMLVLAQWISGWASGGLSPAYRKRLATMIEVSRSVRHPDGRVPQFGDSDSGRVLPLDSTRPPTHDHVLWLGSAVLGGERPIPGDPDAEVAWTFGLDAWRRCTALPESSTAPPVAFRHGGLYVLQGAGMHVVARCGDVGQNRGGGHAHNDCLSYELSFRAPFVVDSGTYCYSSDPRTRVAFRSSRAHNVVVVDGEETNPVREEELFKLDQVATPEVRRWELDVKGARLVVCHDGYRRLAGAPVHEREFALDRSRGSLTITDRLLGTETHTAVSYIHLSPGTLVRHLAPNSFLLSKDGIQVVLACDPRLITDITWGWVSDSFGSRHEGPVLQATLAGRLPLHLSCSFSPALGVQA